MKTAIITTNTPSVPSAARLSRTKPRSEMIGRVPPFSLCGFGAGRGDRPVGLRNVAHRPACSVSVVVARVPAIRRDARRSSMKLISCSADLTSRVSARERDLAAVEHHETVGDVEDVVDVVADEQDRAAARPHLAHEVENLGGLGQRERRRRLVEDDQVGLLVDGAGDRHALALAARELADDRVRREHLRGEADLAHEPVRLGDLLADLQPAERCR